MKTVYRYVLMEMLPTFLLCASALTFLLMTNRISLLLDLVLNKNIPFWDTLLLFSCYLPFVLSMTIPMSMMMGTLLAFGRLSSDMEVTAFKSSGVHLFHLIAPVLVLGFFMTTLMLFFNHKVLPAANFAFKQKYFNILQRQANIAIRERVFIDSFEGYQFLIDRQDPGGFFSDIKAFNRLSPHGSVQTTLAKYGKIVTDEKSYQLFFHLNNGVMNWDNENFHTYNRLYFDHYIIHLKLANQLAQIADVKKDFEQMDLFELQHEAETATDLGRIHYVKTELQKRLALPFACLVLTWFCAPLGLWTRSNGFMGFVLGLLMIFVYYLMFITGQILSQEGNINSVLGLWGANGVLGLAGFFLYYIVISEQSAFKTMGGFSKKAGAQPG